MNPGTDVTLRRNQVDWLEDYFMPGLWDYAFPDTSSQAHVTVERISV